MVDVCVCQSAFLSFRFKVVRWKIRLNNSPYKSHVPTEEAIFFLFLQTFQGMQAGMDRKL